MPSVKAVADFSRLKPPQVGLHSLGFCWPEVHQDTDNHIRKGIKEKDIKEAISLISFGYLIPISLPLFRMGY